MIHFLLLLIKIIGIIVAGMLGLLLLAVLSVLLVPVRYRGRVQKTSDGVFVRGTVSWLLHLLHAELCYGKEGLHCRLRLAGVLLRNNTDAASKAKRTEGQPEPEEKRSEPAEKYPEQEEKQLRPAEKHPEQEEKQSEPAEKHLESAAERAAFREKKKAKESKGSQLVPKLKRVWEVLQRQENKEFLRLAFSKMGKLIKHLLPRKLSGRLIFGSGDPCLTGQLLGVISVAYAKCGKLLELTPDFEEKRLELDMTVRGKLRMGTLGIIVLPVLFDRRGRTMLREIKKAWK